MIKKKAVILLISWLVIVVISIFSMAVLHLGYNDVALGGHKTKRVLAYYTAKAALVHSLEELRKGHNPTGDSLPDDPINGFSANASNNGYTINVASNPVSGGDFDGCYKVEITVNY